MFLLISPGDFLLGAASSFLASVAFIIVLLTFFSPSLEISPYISIQKNMFEDQPAEMYVFKFYNNSHFDAFDAELLLYKVEKYDIGEGKQNERFKGLQLKLPNLKHIPKYRKITKPNQLAPHCLLFRTIEDLDGIFKTGGEVELQITLRHGATGLSNVFKMRYKKDALRNSQFIQGNNLNTI